MVGFDFCQYNSELDETTTKRSETSRTLQQMCKLKQFDTYRVQNAWKHTMHLMLGLGFRWETIAKEIEANKSLN